MKRSKLFAITLQSKSGLIFFFVLTAYNLLLGVYLKDFFELSPMLVTFYLLSALPTLFFVLKIRSAPMRAIVYIVLLFVLLMSTLGFALCRRFLPILTMITTTAEMMYLALFDDGLGKDGFVTKIYVLATTGLILATLFFSYNFICKPDAPYFLNGGATLWDIQTEELADEICAGCDTDAEKAQAFHNWIVDSFEYDFEADPFIQYFDVNKTIRTRKGLCFDFAHLFASFCRSQNIPCYVIDGTSYTKRTDRHTWNRVYYNGTWWDVDITCDILRTQNNEKLYSFCALESVSASDKYYYITKIY